MPGKPKTAPVPLGVYLHLPFCDGLCPYCAFYSVAGMSPDQIDAFLIALTSEITIRRQSLPEHIRPTSIYIGGGTPSLLSVSQLERLCALIRHAFEPERTVEWTIECNPGSINPEKLAMLKAAGVNRISLGGQSLDDGILQQLGRRHQVNTVLTAAEWIRAAGFTNWSLDLIACVPGVGPRRWQTILTQATALHPAHMSVYELTLEEGRELPLRPGRSRPRDLNQARQLQMMRLTRDVLQAAGYLRYEISNYARRGRQCRHHRDFWRGGDYIGFGPAAVSRTGACRRLNLPDLDGYLQALTQGRDAPHELSELSLQEQAAERLVVGLRQTKGVAWASLKKLGLSSDSQSWPHPELRRLEEYGLIQRRRGQIVLTARGFELADAVALELWP